MAVSFSDNERYALLPGIAAMAKDCYYFERKHDVDKFGEEIENLRLLKLKTDLDYKL